LAREEVHRDEGDEDPTGYVREYPTTGSLAICANASAARVFFRYSSPPAKTPAPLAPPMPRSETMTVVASAAAASAASAPPFAHRPPRRRLPKKPGPDASPTA
jgi:hypothetical protein